jgi:outer membrane protein
VKRRLSLKWGICGLVALLQLTAAVCFAKPQMEIQFNLEHCLKLAYQNSEALKTATLKVTKAEQSLKQAEAGLKPSLTYDVYGRASDNASIEGYYGGLTLSQSLYTGGKLQAGIKRSRLELANAREDERQAKQQLTYDVKAAFYQLWLANQKLSIVQAASANMEKHYHDVAKKYQEGAVSHFDLLQAEVNWKKLKPDVISAQNNVKLCRLNLGILIGVKSDAVFTIDAGALEKTVPELPRITVDKGLEIAYRDRPELRQKQNSLESARLDVAIARADYYPKVTASGSYQATGDESGSEWDKVWALKLDLSGTIFNGNQTKAEVAAAEVAVKVAKSSCVQLQDTIRLALESGLQTWEESTEAIAVNQANIALMQNALKLTRYKLEEGLATTTDLMDAQLDLDETLNDYYSGICDYLTAVANLDLILGKVLSKNGGV